MASNDATKRKGVQNSVWQRIADWAMVALFVAIYFYGRNHLGWPIEIILFAWMIPALYRFAKQLSASPRLAGPHRPGPIHVLAWIKSGVFRFIGMIAAVIGLVALIGLLLHKLPQSLPPSEHSHIESAG